MRLSHSGWRSASTTDGLVTVFRGRGAYAEQERQPNSGEGGC